MSYGNVLRQSSTNNRPNNPARNRPGDRLASAPSLTKAFFPFAKIPLNEFKSEADFIPQSKINVDDLKTPTTEVFCDYISALLVNIIPVDPELIRQPVFSCMEQISYNELYDENVVFLCHFFRYARRVFYDTLSFRDFGLRDYSNPERSRFHWQLSALVNLQRFRADRYASFNALAEDADTRAALHVSLRDNHALLQQRVAAINAERASQQQELEQVQDTIRQFSAKLDAQHEQQQQANQDKLRKKETLMKRVERLNSLRAQVAVAREEVARMQSKEVSSPDRYKAEIQSMQDMYETCTTKCAQLQTRNQVMSTHHERLKTLILPRLAMLRAALKEENESVTTRATVESTSVEDRARKASLEEQQRTGKKQKEMYDMGLSIVENNLVRINERLAGVMQRQSNQDVQQEERKQRDQAVIEEQYRLRNEKLLRTEQVRQKLNQEAEDFEKETRTANESSEMFASKMEDFARGLTEVCDIYASTVDKKLRGFSKHVQSEAGLK